MSKNTFSIVIPANNEQQSIATLVYSLKKLYPDAPILVVDDGSTDNTAQAAKEAGADVISHPYCTGNGAAIKTGARAIDTEFIVFMDADGQHSPEDISQLVKKLNDGYEMVVGARHTNTHASISRKIGNLLYNKIASLVTGFKVEDLTSGFRIVNAKLFKRFLYLLPNRFSYPTTITMALLRNGHPISYVPIEAKKREGKSHINIFRDGLRFLIIIIKIASLYSPLKVFTPVSFIFGLLGIANYAYTYITASSFTNMSALLMIISIIVFMMGLLAEQITVLTYAASERRSTDS